MSKIDKKRRETPLRWTLEVSGISGQPITDQSSQLHMYIRVLTLYGLYPLFFSFPFLSRDEFSLLPGVY